MNLDGLARVGRCEFPGLGWLTPGEGACRDLRRTKDGRTYVITFADGNRLIYFPSASGVQAYYPLKQPGIPEPLRGVLMDLDGTTALSEHIWNGLIEQVTQELLANPSFRLSHQDVEEISGFSVEENIRYITRVYGPDESPATLTRAGLLHDDLLSDWLKRMSVGEESATKMLEPAPRLKEMLIWLRERRIKIALVSSAPQEKVLAEIRCVFKKLDMGDPLAFYDVIVSSGFEATRGHPGTMGEACSKPHPWLYEEALHRLGLTADEVIGIEDSAAGILALVAAGIPAIGVGFTNPAPGESQSLCAHALKDLGAVFEWLKARRA